MAKQVTVYEDNRGNLHKRKEDAVKEDAFQAVERAIGLGHFRREALDAMVENADKVVAALQPVMPYITREESDK